MNKKGFSPLENLSDKNSKNKPCLLFNLLNKKNKKWYFLTGFSLIELMVTLSIFAILMAIVLVDFKSAEGKLALERTAYNLSRTIKMAEEMSLGSVEVSGDVPLGGYGVYFSKIGSFNGIFADIDEDGVLSSGEGMVEFKLERNIIFKEFKDDLSGSYQAISSIFLPPDPVISFYQEGGINLSNASEITIAICQSQDGATCLPDLSKTKRVKINKIGLVSIE